MKVELEGNREQGFRKEREFDMRKKKKKPDSAHARMHAHALYTHIDMYQKVSEHARVRLFF